MDPLFEQSIITIPICNDDLYATIKQFIDVVNQPIRELRKHDDELKKINEAINKMQDEMSKYKLSSKEKHYLKTEKFLLETIFPNLSEMEKTLVDNIILYKDKSACSIFDQPIQDCLRRLINYLNSGTDQIILNKQSICDKLNIQIKGLENQKKHLSKLTLQSKMKLYEKVYQFRDDNSRRTSMKIAIPNFKIGITFSGKYREQIVEPVCNELLKLGYNKDEIFYDLWHEALINGVQGDTCLREIYSKKCECVVVLLSPDYSEKNWTCNIEWPAIRELINTGNKDQICLLRTNLVNTGIIDGLYNNQAIAKSVDNMSSANIASFIDERYRLLQLAPNLDN